MAQLTANQKVKLRAALMRAWSDHQVPIAVDKNDLATLINDADTWRNDNAASYNSALTVPGLTAAQKTLLLVADVITVYMVDNPGELQILADLVNQALAEGVA